MRWALRRLWETLLSSPAEYAFEKKVLVRPKNERGMAALNDLSGAIEEI